MGNLIPYAPGLAAMGVLLFCSAFFSSSEAAFFYLKRSDRRRLAGGGRSSRVAAGLLADSDRLLTAVLFWNLAINLTYFTIASIISLRLKGDGHIGEAGGLALGSLLAVILFSEMFPKSLAVLGPRRLATLFALPLAASVRLLAPVIPVFRMANLLSRRLLWPQFQSEPYLRLGDLERAVQLSTSDAALLEQEQAVLQSIVLLSEIRADELMRPRTQFLSFRPPVSLSDLEGRLPPSGYLLVTEPDSDEVAAAIPLKNLWTVPTERLENHAQPVVYVPWCTTVAETLEAMHRDKWQVAAVINEFGETIGILTFDDVLDTIFSPASSRSERLLDKASIRLLSPGTWQATGMTSLRRLARHFSVQLPPHKSLTVAGIIQEELERLPATGDECRWGPFHFKVIDVSDAGQLLVKTGPSRERRGEFAMIWIALGMAASGLFLSAFFSGSETGFYRVTRMRLVLDAMGGDRTARGLLWLTNHPSMFIATALVGNNLANYLTSLAIVIGTQALLTGHVLIAELIAPLMFAPVLFVYGELLPKNLFLRAPNRLLRKGGPLFLFFTVLFLPVSGLLWCLNRVLSGLVRQSPDRVRLLLAKRELQNALDEGHEAGILHPAQTQLARGIFAVASQPVVQHATPPSDVPRARGQMTKDEIRRVARRFRIAEVPIESAGGDQQLVGYVRVIDLSLDPSEELGPIRPFLEVSSNDTHIEALLRMQAAGENLAKVVDADGKTVGILTAGRLREHIFRGR